MTFPPLRRQGESEDGEEITEKTWRATDRQRYRGNACKRELHEKIIHGDNAAVYFWSDNSKAQLGAADMIFNLLGSYAPKKVEGKHDHRVGVFSMRELREKMKEKGVKVTDPIVEGEDPFIQ